MGWYCAIADLIDELPNGELAPWQIYRLPKLAKNLLIDPNNPSRNYTATDCSRGVPSALLLNGQNASNKEVPHKQDNEPAFSITSGAKWASALLIERAGASDARITTRTQDEPAWTLRSSIGTDQAGRNRNEVMNALVGGRVKKLNARAIARLQSVPDWYILPDQMKDAGPLIGNGVPPLLSEAIMRSLLPYVRQNQTELKLNSPCIQTEPQLNIQSTFTPSSDQVQTKFSLNSVAPHPELANVEESLNVEQKPEFTHNSAILQPEFTLSSDQVHHNFNNNSYGVQPTTVSQGERSSCAKSRATAENSRTFGRGTSDNTRISRGSLRGFEQGEATSSSQSLPRAFENRRGNRKGRQRRLEKEEIIQCNSIEPTLKVQSAFTDSSDRVQTEFSRSSVEVQPIIEKHKEKIMVAAPINIVSKEADEQYTPNTKDQPVVNLVIQVLGQIGVDVTADSNRHVPATHHITQQENYLLTSVEGMGTAFMNPPYSCPLPFVQKLCADFAAEHITEAIALLKAGTAHNQGTGTLIKQHASAQCQWGVHTGRIGFIKDGKQRKGADFDCTLYYFGSSWQKFKEVFDAWGLVSLLPKAQSQLIHISDFREQRATDDQLTTDSCQSDLTYDEQRDRLHLEREVEQGFHKAGKALMHLRDRRLYRSTHPSWEAYCQDRFVFSHQNADKKIAAARVVDVLTSNHCQLLPSCVEQAYPLSKLKEEKEIVESWEELTQEGKRPSGRRVSAVVAEICDRQLARGEYHNPWKVGDICQIHKKGDATLAKYDGLWSVVSEVKPRQCVVKVWNKEVLVKAENLEELQVGEDFLSVCDRIRSLMSRHINGDIELKRGQLRFLEALGEQSSMFEPEDLQILKCIEAIANNRDASLVQAAALIVDNIEYLIPEEVQDLSVALRSTHGF
jgi:hypothetical protein